MKKLFLVLSLIVGLPTSANTITQIQSNPMSSFNELRPAAPAASATPIRVAKGRYKIMRSEFVQLPDGSFESKRTTICTGNIGINVFDVRGKGQLVNGPLILESCTDTAAAKRISIGGALVLAHEEIIDTKEDLKLAWGALYVVADANGGPVILPIEIIETAYSGSKDLSSRSFVLQIMSKAIASPGSASYSATLDIED